MTILALLMAGLLVVAAPPKDKDGPAALAAQPGQAKPPTVTTRQTGRELKYAAGMTTYVEGLTLAILGSCSVDRDATEAEWLKALRTDHVRISYDKPRPVGVTASATGQVKDEVLQVSEILLPMSGETFPDFLFVRYGDSYRAFAKYTPQEAFLLQVFLRRSKKAANQ